jgi:hypothetical protein
VIEGRYKAAQRRCCTEIDGVLRRAPHGRPLRRLSRPQARGRDGAAAQQAPAAPAAARVAAGTGCAFGCQSLDPRTTRPRQLTPPSRWAQANGTTIVASGSPVFGKVTDLSSAGASPWS